MDSATENYRVGIKGGIVSVNVGVPRTVDRNGREATTAIWKTPVAGPVRARGVNLDGDDQADRNAHGGPDKAIYTYASEDVEWWEAEFGRAIDVGAFGENFTTQGIDVTGALVGERWGVGGAIFEVSEPRVPCWKLNLRMGEKRFAQRFSAACRPGAYLRIIEEGDVAAGDTIEILSVPAHDLTVSEVLRIYTADRAAAAQLLEVADLSEAWHTWAQQAVERAGTGAT